MDDSFTKVAVQVPKLSGFDKSHQNLLTSKVGTITPILIDELMPGSKIYLKVAVSAQLPPLAADTFMRCQIKMEAFAIPLRLLCGSFESWFTDTPVAFQAAFSTASSFTEKVGFLPCIGSFGSNAASISPLVLGPGKLSDYLGIRASGAGLGANLGNYVLSALPFLAYHRVYDDWYRNTLVQRPVFVRPMQNAYVQTSGQSSNSAPSSLSVCAGTAPFYFYSETQRGTSAAATQNYIYDSSDALTLADGVKLYSLRQRNFGLDYFTTATPSPQLGAAMTVSFGLDPNGDGSSSSFSIAALRAANSLQQFRERNNLSGSRFQDQLRARYGANLSNGVAQRSLFLGGASFDVYTKGIYQQGQDVGGGSGTQSETTNNPFQATTGAKFGAASASGQSLNISFEANEPCYLLVNATLVPKVTYSSGIDRMFTRYCGAGSLADMANPILQNVGPQPIYQYELNGDNNTTGIFGFTDRYADFKTKQDTLHGLVRDGSSLQAFALQRSFASGSTPQITSAFLEIPTNYMDQVTATSNTISAYGYWMDTYFDYKVSQPLAKYSLPSLQDPAYEHGRTVVMQKGGQKL